MIFAVGLGQIAAAVFQLIAHGFFKAGLFLCAGNIAHASGKSTVSVSEVGGLARPLPLTCVCLAICAASLAGIWPAAGFFSKDAILDAAAAKSWTAAAGLAIGIGGAFYIFRLLFLTFGPRRPEQQPRGSLHEAEPIMGVPTVILSIGALLVGWFGTQLTRMLSSGWPKVTESAQLPAISAKTSALGMGAAAVGLAAAYALTWMKPSWDWEWRRRRPRTEALLARDFGWRDVVSGAAAAAGGLADRIGRSWDRDTWDAAIEGSANFYKRLSRYAAAVATGSMSDALWYMMAAAVILLAWVMFR
jgi:NADH-quinone oxidoreductase subunit L